jgi:hypothetical protein
LRDTGVIIALVAQAASSTGPDPNASGDENGPPPKAVYRAAQALVALERWDEAADCILRGSRLHGEGTNRAWAQLGEQVQQGGKKAWETAERARRAKLTKAALTRAVQVSSCVVFEEKTQQLTPHPDQRVDCTQHSSPAGQSPSITVRLRILSG